jgi:hypothetical protein
MQQFQHCGSSGFCINGSKCFAAKRSGLEEMWSRCLSCINVSEGLVESKIIWLSDYNM